MNEPFTIINLNKKTETKNKITKKGIVITALIVIGIVGASFIVYLVPWVCVSHYTVNSLKFQLLKVISVLLNKTLCINYKLYIYAMFLKSNKKYLLSYK